MTEIQRKSILVRVSARFELARVRVIGIQLLVIVQTFLVVTTAGSLREWRQGSYGLLKDLFKNRSKEPPGSPVALTTTTTTTTYTFTPYFRCKYAQPYDYFSDIPRVK